MRRRLTTVEVDEAQLVFGNNLPYARVRVAEGVLWPNWVARFGSWISRSPPPTTPNAVTLGNTPYFPTVLRTGAEDLDAGFLDDMAWLIHELTHVWQFHKSGPRYILDALRAHSNAGGRIYDYGGRAGLQEAISLGQGLSDFNPEQQGEITRHYYIRFKLSAETGPWEPFIAEVRSF